MAISSSSPADQLGWKGAPGGGGGNEEGQLASQPATHTHTQTHLSICMLRVHDMLCCVVLCCNTIRGWFSVSSPTVAPHNVHSSQQGRRISSSPSELGPNGRQEADGIRQPWRVSKVAITTCCTPYSSFPSLLLNVEYTCPY